MTKIWSFILFLFSFQQNLFSFVWFLTSEAKLEEKKIVDDQNKLIRTEVYVAKSQIKFDSLLRRKIEF